MATLRARGATDIEAVLKAVRDMEYRFDAVAHDGKARTLTLPVRKRFPRREGRLLLRGVSGFAVEGRAQQESECIRGIAWDGAARRLVLEGAPARLVVAMDALDLEVEDGHAAAPTGERTYEHVPEAHRPALMAREAEHARSQERYEESRRSTERNLGLGGVLVSSAAGLIYGSPWWAMILHVATGYASGAAIGRYRIDTPALSAVVLAVPVMALSFTGSMFAMMMNGAGMVGAVFFSLWLMVLVVGALAAWVAIHRTEEGAGDGTVLWAGSVKGLEAMRPSVPVATPWRAAADESVITRETLRKVALSLAGASFALPLILGANVPALLLGPVPCVLLGSWGCVRRGWSPAAVGALFALPLWIALESTGGVNTGVLPGTLFLVVVHLVAGFGLGGWVEWEKVRRLRRRDPL